MTEVLAVVKQFVWGLPTLLLIVGVGLYISLRTGFIQVRLLPRALCHFFSSLRNRKASGANGYSALCTALAATVGTGNLVGVAGAIAIGGPGAVFWMWVCAFLGMGIKYAEATLAVRYRTRNTAGEGVGGPMYMIEHGLSRRWHPLAGIYCFFGVIAAFGVGNAAQVNAVIGAIGGAVSACGYTTTFLGNLLLGLGLAVAIGTVLFGGANRIGRVAERLVPFAAGLYLLLCLAALFLRRTHLPGALNSIFTGAFSPQAVTGGTIGSLWIALRTGASRGIFTNEAGMGTAAIAHASAEVSHPAQQGLMGMVEVFLDTLVICTMTALVILSSGVPIRYGVDSGALLTTGAFTAIFGPWAATVIALALCCFAFATILGWGLYGARCAQYLFGDHAWKGFSVCQLIVVMLGAVLQTGTVWMLAEIVNALMAIPNLIALFLLSPELNRLTKTFTKR